MNIRPILLIMLSTLLLGNSAVSKADPQIQSHASIIAAVQQFLESQIDTKQHNKINTDIGHLDSRLRLNSCEQTLETYLPPGGKLSGKTSIGVRCNAPKPWALYVPVTINIISSVYKTARNLTRGHIIREQDIVSAEYNLSRLNYGYFTRKEELIGKQIRRRLKQDQVITPSQIIEPLMVKKGDKVTLIAQSERFSIRMNGEAMMNGVQGDRVRVKNLSSSRIIEGTVTQNSEVTVYN